MLLQFCQLKPYNTGIKSLLRCAHNDKHQGGRFEAESWKPTFVQPYRIQGCVWSSAVSVAIRFFMAFPGGLDQTY